MIKNLLMNSCSENNTQRHCSLVEKNYLKELFDVVQLMEDIN